MVFRLLFLFLIVLLAFTSCKQTDDIAPVITLEGDTLVNHPLNETYDDEGASAQDETDGDVTSKIFIDNPVNVDWIGEYFITYSVVDEAGNEANPVSRTVMVYNEAEDYEGNYTIHEAEVPPGTTVCDSVTSIRVDSNFNWRIVFTDFICSSGYEVYADIDDSLLVMPFQIISDSLVTLSVQGSGKITDSTMSFQYSKTIASETTYWEVFMKIKE